MAKNEWGEMSKLKSIVMGELEHLLKNHPELTSNQVQSILAAMINACGFYHYEKTRLGETWFTAEEAGEIVCAREGE